MHTALNQLRNTAGITATWRAEDPLDGLLLFDMEGREIPFTAYIKKELRHYQLSNLLQLHNEYRNLMVVAGVLFPKIKETLRANGIAYLEANGNVYVKEQGIYYFIDTNKNTNTLKDKANRAFTKTGLKVIFHLLENKELLNKTQREIAEITGVALGNIPQVLNGLKETGYLLPMDNKTYVWEKREELLERWIHEYATGLRPKLKKGNYMLKDDWKTLNLNTNLTVWGGEPAADLLTNHLRPEKLVLHTKENPVNLMKNYRFIPNEGGNLEVFEMFWKNEGDKNTAPPILVYAELVLAGGKRNIETAQKIFDEYIKPNL